MTIKKLSSLTLLKIAITIAVFAWFGTLLAHKIDLTTADLGRHIENGSIIIHGTWSEKWAVLHTNFYSYTQTNQPFINHHWFSGVMFYVIFILFGFVGLSVWYVLFGLLTLWLFFDVARKSSNFWVAISSAVIITPLVTSRAEVRPEMFTYFLTGVFFWILWHWREQKISTRWLWALPLLMLFWINLHIGFVFGFLVLGAFGLEQLIKDVALKFKDKKAIFPSPTFRWLLLISICCVVAGVINPNFIRGFLYPLYIFKNYGYLVVENQSIKFLENINFTQGEHFLLYKIIGSAIFVSFIGVAIRNWRKLDVAMLILSGTTAVMGYLAIRNFPSFSFFAIPALAANIYIIIPKKLHPAYYSAMGILLAGVVGFAIFQQYNEFLAVKPGLGFGLLPGAESSADFFKANNIQGPIFNDYDVGSYLIYNLYPEKVFVDNRPEAYSVNFLQNVYIPGQQDPAKWAALENQYHFNVIFFSYRDYTPWAQAFLIARVQDPAWAPVYVDSFNIIFLRRDNPANAAIIKQFELPKSMFGITTN